MVQELVKKHHVTIITCCPHYPKPQTKEKSKFKLVDTIREKNLLLIRIWIPSFNMDTTVGRILDYSWFTFSFLLGLPHVKKPDVIWSTSPNLFCGFTATIAKRIFRCPSIANIDDIWPEAPIELGYLKPGVVKRVAEYIGIHAFDGLDAITPISETISNFCKKKYARTRVFTIPVGFHASRLQLIIKYIMDTKREPKHVKKPTNDAQVRIMYSGILGPAYDFELLLKAFKMLVNEHDIALTIRGTGPRQCYIENLIKKHKVRNVSFETRYLSTEELNQKLLSTDIFVLPMVDNFISKTALPTKLFEYMAFGKPVVVYGTGEPRMLVEQ
nr:glycosyltransferase family 4 protein [Candidatus Sigynarchaeota archaeon]